MSWILRTEFYLRKLSYEKKLLNFKKKRVASSNKEIININNILEMNKKSETYESNLQILKEVLKNIEGQDRNEIHKIFKLLIKKIDFISRNSLKFKIYIQ